MGSPNRESGLRVHSFLGDFTIIRCAIPSITVFSFDVLTLSSCMEPNVPMLRSTSTYQKFQNTVIK